MHPAPCPPFTYIPGRCLGQRCVSTFSTWCGNFIGMVRIGVRTSVGKQRGRGDGSGDRSLPAAVGKEVWRWGWKGETKCQRVFVWLEWRKVKDSRHSRKAGRRPWSHPRKPLRKLRLQGPEDILTHISFEEHFIVLIGMWYGQNIWQVKRPLCVSADETSKKQGSGWGDGSS